MRFTDSRGRSAPCGPTNPPPSRRTLSGVTGASATCWRTSAAHRRRTKNDEEERSAKLRAPFNAQRNCAHGKSAAGYPC
jgi:hypothetical protein